MNVIWIVADTFRQDHLGAYGHPYIRTPALDALAKRSTQFNRHYLDGFPTMPARANHHTGPFVTRFMGWERFRIKRLPWHSCFRRPTITRRQW